METKSYHTQLRDYLQANALPPDKFSHQARLWSLLQHIGQLEGKLYDHDVAYAATWLHDLGVFIGHRPEDPSALAHWDHIAYAIAQAPALLQRFGFPEDKIPAVLEAIKTHMPKHQPASYEGVLLRDADILEQLGAVSILRTVSKVGRDTRFRLFSDALRVLRTNLEELPGMLALASSRKLAEPRMRILQEFLHAAELETGDIPW